MCIVAYISISATFVAVQWLPPLDVRIGWWVVAGGHWACFAR